MTPVGVFFICQNEDKCHFVNSTTMKRISRLPRIRIRDKQNSWKEQPTNKANGNQKSLGHLKGAKTIAR